MAIDAFQIIITIIIMIREVKSICNISDVNHIVNERGIEKC